jgi:hypothetical protein
LHWQGVAGFLFASAQVGLQCFLPLAAWQLQPGHSHLCVVVMKTPLSRACLRSFEGSAILNIVRIFIASEEMSMHRESRHLDMGLNGTPWLICVQRYSARCHVQSTFDCHAEGQHFIFTLSYLSLIAHHLARLRRRIL